MRFWDKSLRIFKCLCNNTPQSIRHLARQTGLSKSSVHRLKQALERRGGHPESWLWETAEGRQWLARLVVATLYIFGLKRGVGLDTMHEFFVRLHLATQVGCSPSALRGVMQALEAALLKTAGAWEQEGRADGEEREIIGAVDETFFAQMMLVFMDLKTGYLLLEETAEDRTYTTWKTLVDERLKALGTGVLYLVSDRAKALIQLAEQGLGCFSMPDFFHLVHEIVKSYSLALGRRMRQAHKELREAREAVARLQGRPYAAQEAPAAQALVTTRQAAVIHWEEAHHTYRCHLETFSLTLHPFRIADSAPQSSAQIDSHLQAAIEAIEGFAQDHQLPARPAAITKVRKQVPALAAVVDFWWEGVKRDLAHAALSPLWRQWAEEYLLPLVYWEHQVAHTRCRRRKAKLRQALEARQGAFNQHALTQCLPPQGLKEWHAWATHRVSAFQRASSAVEGRNGYLSQMHHNHRGLPKRRYKVWTVRHNFDCRAADGTTPASRFFQRTFPDLFETVVAHIEALPQPRRRKHQVALSP
jgi:DNA-binding MarR family transcriptional regulator